MWKYPTQLINSLKTSINSTKIASSFKKIKWMKNTRNADIGGGLYDNATTYLNKLCVENIIFDPFNRTKEHNDSAIQKIRDGQCSTATINNVLNVIKEEVNREQVIQQAYNCLMTNGVAYFLIYEGNKNGIGKETSKGWQENRKTDTYIEEIQKYFNSMKRKGNLIIAFKFSK